MRQMLGTNERRQCVSVGDVLVFGENEGCYVKQQVNVAKRKEVIHGIACLQQTVESSASDEVHAWM